jgi:hypothetical protein
LNRDLKKQKRTLEIYKHIILSANTILIGSQSIKSSASYE